MSNTLEKSIKEIGWVDAEEGREKIAQILEEDSRKKNIMHAMYSVDLDGLGLINQFFSWDDGDEAIKKAAKKLITLFKKSDVFIWNGADQFVIFAREMNDFSYIELMANGITHKVDVAVEGKGRIMFLSATVGVSVYPFNGDNYYDLLENSMHALFSSKEKSKNSYEIFEASETLAKALKLKVKHEEHVPDKVIDMTTGQVIHLINIILSEGSNVRTHMETVLKIIMERFGFERSYMSLQDINTLKQTETVYSVYGVEDRDFASKNPLFLDVIGKINEHSHIGFIQNYDDISLRTSEYLMTHNVKTMVCTPMCMHDNMQGVLMFLATENHRFEELDEKKEEFLMIIRFLQMFLLKFGKENSWSDTLSKLKMLYSFDSYVMLIDYPTRKLLFTNKSMYLQMPDTNLGDDYNQIMHLKEVAPNDDEISDLDPLNENDSFSLDCFSEGMRKWLKLNISWFSNEEDNQVVLVNAIDITDYLEMEE